MNTNVRTRIVILTLLAGLLTLPIPAATLNATYDVNTSLASALPGTDCCFLSWYVSPGGAQYTLGSVSVTNAIFLPSGGLTAPPVISRDTALVHGTLNDPADPMWISNDYNSLAPSTPPWAGEYLQLAQLSQNFQFTLNMTFQTPVSGDAGTVVVFSLFTNSAGVPGGPAINMARGDGAIGQIDFSPDSGFSFTALETADGQTLMRDTSTSAIPEPATMFLLPGGLLAVCWRARRRFREAKPAHAREHRSGTDLGCRRVAQVR